MGGGEGWVWGVKQGGVGGNWGNPAEILIRNHPESGTT